MKAAVVGAGPNGLVAAIELARAGLEVTVFEAHERPGGALRSATPFGDDHIVDVGATSMPFAAMSPAMNALPLADHGLEWVHPTAPLAHPLDDRPAALLHHDLDQTADALGRDGRGWRRIHGPIAKKLDQVAAAVLQPMLPPKGNPLVLASLGLRAAPPSAMLTRLALRDEPARALFTGSAAHAWQPLTLPTTSAFGVLLGAAAHAVGWPFVAGGSERLAEALVSVLASLGGKVVTGTRITDLREIDHDMVLLDVDPGQAARLLGPRVPESYRAALRRFRRAPAAARVDLLLDGDVPWRDPAVGDAGVVHLGGSAREIEAAEQAVVRGRMPERPFVLAAQQARHDASRRGGHSGHRAVWAYAHVPNGYDRPVLDQVLDQFERFAPGVRDRVVGTVETSPADLERENPNLVGGDIIGGSSAGLQLLMRPTPSLRPYRTPDARVWLCSASTPPGGGVHGMNGLLAARAALRSRGIALADSSPAHPSMAQTDPTAPRTVERASDQHRASPSTTDPDHRA